jgi:hypothetical protein
VQAAIAAAAPPTPERAEAAANTMVYATPSTDVNDNIEQPLFAGRKWQPD